MKRILAIILSVLLLIPAACADDYSAMSYEDLLALRETITAEIMSRPEWKEVKVPAGTWIVGKDIPVGSYSFISHNESLTMLNVEDTNGDYVFYKPLHKDELVGRIDLLEGYKLYCYAEIVMAPAVSIGF